MRVSSTTRLRLAGRISAVLLVLLNGVGAPARVDAQETRAELIAEEQADKAKELHPYEPSTAERALTRVETALTETPRGFYPYFGSVYNGGGFALGPAYRRFYGDRTFWDLKGLFSIRAYKFVELSTDSLGHSQGRLDLYSRAGWRDATRVAFHGIGMTTPESGRTNFDLKQAYITGGLRARPLPWTVLGAAVSYEDFTAEGGADVAPSSPTYLHSTASAGIDWRPAAGYARKGGFYEVAYHNYADCRGSSSFDRVDAQVVQHLPILRENWVLSFRGQLQTTLDDDDAVPYFLLPSLGSGSTLRGYSSWRFRDRHSVLASAEWRWIPSRLAFDMALFYDAGKVTSRRSDLDFHGLKSDVGIGARFHGPAFTPLRIELAHGSEGLRLVFSGSAAF